jgi:tetratricopeptide (TPR) repeat protein
VTASPTLGFFLASTLLACFNVDERNKGHSLDGDIRPLDNIGSHFRRVMSSLPLSTTVRQRFRISKDAELTEEMQAIERVYRGDYQSGLEMLQKLEEQNPGTYNTASNIGTTYELMGDNVSALKWIKDAIVRNPKSHRGTEWLHALILEAKVESAGHTDLSLHHRLLDVPDRISEETSITVDGKSHSAAGVRNALYYQLNERLLFVKPRDPYVADRLYSYALIEANLGTTTSALELLQLAREYGFPDEALLKKHENWYKGFLWWDPRRRLVGGYLAAIAGVLFVIFCVRRIWRLRQA